MSVGIIKLKSVYGGRIEKTLYSINYEHVTFNEDRDYIIRKIAMVMKNDKTAYLMAACYLRNAYRMLEILLDEFNSDINISPYDTLKDVNHGLTMFHFYRNDITHKETADVLRKHIHKFKHIELEDADGNTPVMIACCNGDFELVKVLMELKPNINKVNKYGYTALYYAALSNNFELVKYLLENGADPNPPFHRDSISPLFVYINEKIKTKEINPDIVYILLAYGSKIRSIAYLNKLDKNDKCIRFKSDIISICLDYDSSASRYRCVSNFCDRISSRYVLRNMITSEYFPGNSILHTIMYNFRRSFISDRDYTYIISMIICSSLDDNDEYKVYTETDVLKLDGFRENQRKLLKYKLSF